MADSHHLPEDVINERDEVGFFFLKDAAVSLCKGSEELFAKADERNGSLKFQEWIDVDIAKIHDPGMHQTSDKVCDGTSPVDTCPRCHLLLHLGTEEKCKLQFKESEMCSFSGCAKDLKCCDSHKDLGSQTNRSDGALLLGTIMKCKSAGYLRIESFQVLVSGEGDTSADGSRFELPRDNEESDNDEIRSDHYRCKQVRASIVITVSLPHLEKFSKLVCTSDEDHSQQQFGHYDEYLTTSSAGFPSHGQLLFSLIRCDWDWLDLAMQRLRTRSQSESPPSTSNINSIFPSSTTLEELYARIRGASLPQVASCTAMNLEDYADSEAACIAGALTLPEDLLQSKLAPYLRAKSLHSLRSTCQYLHTVLKSVVPGMKLELFPHQIRSLHWMRRREERHVTDDDVMNFGPNNIGIDEVMHGDIFRSVTSGGIVSLTPRQRKGSFWHINTWTGRCSLNYRNHSIRTVARCRNVARGGLLCDDPGLGKTITILSLVLQTFGQSTQKVEGGDVEELLISDDEIIDAYWREILVSHTRRDELLELTLKLRKHDQDQFFQYPVKDLLTAEEWDIYKDTVKDPICMEDVICNIRSDSYEASIGTFVEDVKRIYSTAITYNHPGTKVYKKAESLLSVFADLLQYFKEHQRKSATATAKRSNLSLGSLIDQNKRRELLNSLTPSACTLIVVPSTLVQHWEEQIKLHIDFPACSSTKLPLIYRHRIGHKYRRQHPYQETSNYDVYDELCNQKCSHFPFLLIDECTETLPSPLFLSHFCIVLTTTKRFTMEWKNGSLEEELRQGKQGSRRSYRSFNYDLFNEYGCSSPCSLLKIHWLRLVVDEGHSMGKNGQPTNAIDFASWITAERRWAMTGTPTPQTLQKSGLGNLFGLIRFLKHDYFCTTHWGDERCKSFNKGIKDGQLATFFNLRHLLNLFMVRHTKKDVAQLHKPVLTVTQTSMSKPETLAYNTLVSAVQMNLVITSMEGKTSGKQDSLLNARQNKHAKQALGNIRLACSGGTQIVPTLTTKNWAETITLMEDKHNANGVQIRLVQNFLGRMTTEELSSCMHCGIQLQTLFLLPCCCTICTECLTEKNNFCIVCNSHYDTDDFQLLQPGLDYVWKWNIIEAEKEREQKRTLAANLESVRQRETTGNAEAQRIGNEVLARILPAPIEDNRPRVQRRWRKKEAHICKYPAVYIDGKCNLCSDLHMCILNENQDCNICHNKAEECPVDESKSYYLIDKLKNLLKQYKNRGIEITGEAKRPLKVIIFSQFKQVSNLVGDRLIRRFGTGCVAEYWGSTRNLELTRFTKSEDCFCMLLTKDGSHGLNLSFVTHIFFLDEIFDKSLESQVVARAYRMGATEHVFVEQLVAKHSIEELIVKMNKRDGLHNTLYCNGHYQPPISSEYYNIEYVSNQVAKGDKVNPQAKKIGFLLQNAKLIRPPRLAKRKRSNNQNGGSKEKRSVAFEI